DYTVASDADRNLLRSAVAAEFVIIGTHYHAIANSGAALNNAAHANDAALDVAVGYDTAIGNDRLAQGCPIDFASGKKTRMRINGRVGFEKAVGWNEVGEIEIGFIEGANRSDIFPVAIENVGTDVMCLDCGRNDVLAEIK